MSQAEITFFECNDLRNLLFSYLRKIPKKSCYHCGCVVVWDKKVKQHVEMTWVYQEPVKSICMNCWNKFAYQGPPCVIS